MRLPVSPPVKPMLARAVSELPEDTGSCYEPKWDGFRCIVFRDGGEVVLGSRNEKPLTRYFPDVVAAALDNLPERCVVDGEIVIVTGDRLDFEALLQRIHPADSRVRRLAEQTPASFVAFDLLALGEQDTTRLPYERRRALLEKALASAEPPVHLTRVTTEVATAREWFASFEGAGLDGLVVKAADSAYVPDKRLMRKLKHDRTADCVVGGFRWHKSGPVIGSLLLGIYDEQGKLQHVGVSASFTAARRKELVDELAPYRTDSLDGHPWRAWAEADSKDRAPGTSAAGRLSGTPAAGRLPGTQSRWNAGKDLSWQPLRPGLVVEVAYDHLEGSRFRHTAQFRRWRPDREPASCTYDQLEVPVRYDLADVLR